MVHRQEKAKVFKRSLPAPLVLGGDEGVWQVRNGYGVGL